MTASALQRRWSSFTKHAGVILAAIFVCLAPTMFGEGFASAQERRIVIGYSARDFNTFAPFVAESKGFFLNAGIAPELVQIRSPVALAGLLSGSIDYTTSFSSAIGPAMQGAPLRGVLAMVVKPSFYLIARPEIRTVADLKGKTIAVGSVGTINHLVTQKILSHFGLEPQDFTIMSLGDTPVRMAAVKTGSVQATMAGPPAPAQAKAWGFNVLAYAGDYIDLPLAGVVTTTNKIKNSRNELVSVLTAVLRGLALMKTNRAETIGLIQKLLKMEKSVAEATYDLSIDSFSVDGTISTRGIQNVIEMSSPQVGGRQVAPSEVVDFGPLREAQALVRIR